MPAIYCCMRNCWKGLGKRHSFPNPEKSKVLFDKWVNLCGNSLLRSEMTPKKIFTNCRVCSSHFKPEDFGPNQKLKKGVLPSLLLPEPLEPLEEPAVLNIAESSEQPSTSSEWIPDTCKDSVETPIASGSTTMSIKKRRSSLLAEVDVTNAKDLTPKAKHLFKRAIYFKKRAARTNFRKNLFRKRLVEAEKCKPSEALEKMISSMDRVRARFFQSQIENTPRKPKGRRYTLEDKVLALALYKQSGSAYRLLSRIFSLPSRRTIMRLLNRIPIFPGLHEEIFTILKAETHNFSDPLDKYCVLMFDEVSIQPNLQPNLADNVVDGFEDFGFKRTEKMANHAQVFMLRGIKRKWKQPVYYNFVNGCTKKEDIAHIIKLIIRRCQQIGITILATVCDQGSNNQSAVNALVRDTRAAYLRDGVDYNKNCFEVDGDTIIPLYDVPHLFKGLRNNLLKYPLYFKENGEDMVGRWDHIYMAYKMDPHLGCLRLMPKITDAHANPDKINKMKVSKCTQVFSHTVAAAINVFAFSGTTVKTEEETLTMDKSAMDTATLLEFLDKLFDSLNGSSFNPPPGKTLRSGVTQGSHHLNHWDVAIEKIKSFRYERDGKFFIPPSVKNLISTIRNFKVLWGVMKEIGFQYLMPRTFNQDPLENFFGKIRQKGQRNINPTPTAFKYYYKSLLVNQLTSSHSIGANCEDDNSEIFLTLQRLVAQGLPEEDDKGEISSFCEVPQNLPTIVKPLEAGALRYVAGYVAKKIGKLPDCHCKHFYFKTDGKCSENNELYIKFKEYDRFQRLKYVNTEFYDKLKNSLAIIKYIFNRNLHNLGIIDYTLNILKERIFFTNCEHDAVIKTTVFRYFIKINLFNYCKQVNNIFKGLDLRTIPKNAPKLFLSAKKLCNNRSKRKISK